MDQVSLLTPVMPLHTPKEAHKVSANAPLMLKPNLITDMLDTDMVFPDTAMLDLEVTTLANVKPKPNPITDTDMDTVTDTVMDTGMADTDMVTITAKDLPNPNLTTVMVVLLTILMEVALMSAAPSGAWENNL